MVDIIEISAVVAASGVLVGVIYYVMDIRHNMKAREVELIRASMEDVLSEQALLRFITMMTLQWKDPEDFMAKYGYSNPVMMSKWLAQFMVWESSGIIVKSKLLSPEKIYALGGFAELYAWEKYKDIVQARRAVWGQDYLSNAEFFVQEMVKVKTKHDAEFKDKRGTFVQAMEAQTKPKTV